MGFTLVCDDVTRSAKSMTKVCPAKVFLPWAQAESRGKHDPTLPDGCSCLPRRGVEQDVASGMSPLGINYQGCVKLEQDVIFPNIKGSILLKALKV